MTTVTDRDIIEQIKQLNFNPSEIHRVILNGIQQSSAGITLYNPSNPMMATIESGILTSTAVLEEIQAITRPLYAPVVDNWEDLYLHQQDEDINEMNSQPSEATVNFFMSIEELKKKAVPLASNSDIKMIEFPRHTQITVGDYKLMLKFPITIRINSFGNISIKYDLSGEAVLGNITNALINYSFIRYNDIDAITFPVEVVQVELASSILPVSQTSGFRKVLKINDKLFKLKAYTRFNQNSEWIEIDVTRRMRALNKNRTTMQLIEGNNQVTIQIPIFYLINGMMGTEVRIEIYTTKGAVEHSLVNYNEASYSMKYFDYNNKNNQYAGILGSFSIMRIYSADSLVGGRNRLSFDEAKKRVINRSSISEGVPITELELSNKLLDYGMSSTKIIDDVTDRIYAASRLIPPPTSEITVTGVGCNVQTHQITFEELEALDTVRGNGNRLTVLPTTLYNVDNGVLKVVNNLDVQRYTNPALTTPEALATWANSNKLVYSPYFYVHDIAQNEYTVRPYRLDNPMITKKITVNENATLQLDASIYNYELFANEDLTGYTLYLGLAVGQNFKTLSVNNISLQITYLDDTGNNRYHLNGVLDTAIDASTGRPVGDNYIYRFDLTTDWDIDEDHNLILNDSRVPVPLEGTMDVFVIIKDYRPDGFIGTQMDSITSVSSLANYDGQTTQDALIQERLTIKLGTYMSNLWNRARTTIRDADYKRYTENVPATYTENVYKRDANGVIEYGYVDGKVVPLYLYRKGDVVEIEGVIQYKHRVGDIVLENGEPVYLNGLRGLTRQFDLVVMDGLYYLTTHTPTINYVKSVLNLIDGWVFNVLRDAISPELLERTTVYYHPKSTVGLIEVYTGNGVKTLVQSDQELYIQLYVGDVVYTNTDLRNSIEVSVKKIIQKVLESDSTISVSDLTRALMDNLGENIFGVDIKGFMNDEHNTITVVDSLTTPSLGKRLVVNSKLELVVEDSVEIEFIWHTRKTD